MAPPRLLAALAFAALAAAHAPAARARTSQGARSRVSAAPAAAYRLPAAGAPPSALIAATLAAFPAAVADNGDLNVTLLALAGAAPSPDDFISLTCGPVASASDFFDAVTLNDLAAQQPVSVVFASLPFLRCAWFATYWSTVYVPDMTWVSAGNLTVPLVESYTAPKQVHLAVTAASWSSMVVAYATGGPLRGRAGVQYAPHGNATLGLSALATTATYAAADMCGAPANTTSQGTFRDPGLLHNATMTGLEPGAAYDYRVGSDEDGWSAVFTFSAAPAPGTPVRFVAYGDQSIDPAAHNTSLAVAAAAAAGDAQFCLVNGDLGYAMGSAWVWDEYLSIIQPATTIVPHAFQIGNHEYDWAPSGTFAPSWWNNGYTASSGECGVPFAARFPSPSADATPFWYSFTFGDVFMVAISSEHNWTEGSEQWLWLNATLSSVDRTVTPWLMVSMHRPIYSTQECEAGDYVVALYMRQALDLLLWTHRVDVALVAHTHAYERTCAISSVPAANCTTPGPTCGCAPAGTGTTHFTIGAAGAGLEGCGYSPQLGAYSQSHVNAWGLFFVDTESVPGKVRVRFQLDADGSTFDEALVSHWDEAAARAVEAQW